MDLQITPAKKRKQAVLTLVEKLLIAEEAEAGGSSYDMIAASHGVSVSSVYRFVNNKDAIRTKLANYREHGVENRRTLKGQSFPLLEEALYVWVIQQREQNIIVTSDILKAKAEHLFLLFQSKDQFVGQKFLSSDGWARRFKQRYGLRVLRVAGEKASADVEAYHKFKDILMAKILEMNLEKCQVYNADESALFIKMMASRSIVLWDEKIASGRKMNKTRFTFLPCSNIDGSLKMKLMFIGTAAKPRDFPHNFEKCLPVSYHHSKKAWMTRDLFRCWFHDEFVPAVREFSIQHNLEPTALLVLDNCTAHHEGDNHLLQSDDGKIQVIYLPPNVTSECQPMDQAVINAVKIRYKRKLMLYLVMENEDMPLEERLKSVSLRRSIAWLADSWDEVSPSTIEQSWKKLIDEFPGSNWSSNTDEFEIDKSWSDLPTLVHSLDAVAGTYTTDEEMRLWVQDKIRSSDGNAEWTTSQVFTDAEIVDSVLNTNNDPNLMVEEWLDTENTSTNEFDITPVTTGVPDFQTTLKSLDVVMKYMEDDPADFCKLAILRTKIVEAEWNKRK